jgi:hypothetical protein
MTAEHQPILDESPGEPSVRGFLHRSETAEADGLVLTHGAGSNCNAPLLITLATAFAAAGLTTLRCDLPFRQARPHGPPLGTAEKDQAGLRRGLAVLRRFVNGRVFVGGHSYGGRMASMLAAREPEIADGLLLLSYPLHPPKKPQQLRTAHFPNLRTRALFVQGMRDPFATTQELQSALSLIPAQTKLVPIESAGHELLSKSNRERLVATVVLEFTQFFPS